MNKIEEFISRRFKNNCNWLDGNCYYFAIILKDRFPEGKIYYEVIDCHFVFEYQNEFYDWTGKINCNLDKLVEWDKFDEYDKLQKEIIIRDCIL